MDRWRKNKWFNRKDAMAQRSLCLFVVFVSLWATSHAQRQDIDLHAGWLTTINNKDWKKVNVPHNWDDYYGYRRLLHGNLHGDAEYRKEIKIKQSKTGKRFFLFFEGVGSYAEVFLNDKKVGQHSGGRTTFTIDITDQLKTDGSKNELTVKASHPANIQNLPWVCGGCSDERGFSEGSQPMGIFRPVHLIVTNDVRIEPFGVHAWATIEKEQATLWVNTTFKNYSPGKRNVQLVQQLQDVSGKIVAQFATKLPVQMRAKDSMALLSTGIKVSNPVLWSVKNPYLYKIVSIVKENNVVLDKTITDFGFRTINWENPTNQFFLNGEPVFLNGIAEYEHILGQSHAFSPEQIQSRIKWIQAAGFNAFRDGHQPHNLLYGKLFNEKGILWWTQLSAHVWYDTKEFRDNFKQLLKEWVIERRNDPSVILWGLQNESKLPTDFAKECTELIRSLDPTASSQRLVTTCNGGTGTDWDVPQNWTGTYGGNPAMYDKDVKKQVLIGEYGAWRTIDLHTEGGFVQNGVYSEDRMVQLMEQKVRLAEKVKDSAAGHFFWLLTSHDNPGRVQGGEGLREMDRIGPVNYKGLLTPWEEPTDAYYMYRSNYAPKETAPMVYIVSHTWPNRWMTAGIKDSIYVYSNCDEVELFNDVNGSSLGKRKRNGIGTHFQWDNVEIRYNVLYAEGYVNGKKVVADTIVLNHLPPAPHYTNLYAGATNITKPQAGYTYEKRINCGGADYIDENGRRWEDDQAYTRSWTRRFPELPANLASQRRTFSPLKGTKDWKLFQSFRYGKQDLGFEVPAYDGEYLVELYFIEPWLGIGGGVDAKGMRVFDVAINGKVILDDLDIWSEAGTNRVLKKTVKAKASRGKLVITFPETKAGQAVISAFAIASQHSKIKEADEMGKSLYEFERKTWMDIGDKQYLGDTITFNALPSDLYGADWISFRNKLTGGSITVQYPVATNVFVGIKKAMPKPSVLNDFENTGTQIVTDEKGGTFYTVYKKRFEKDVRISLDGLPENIIASVRVNNMQPAYDLKVVTPYRTNVAIVNKAVTKDSVNGRLCALVQANEKAVIEWPVQTGVGDIYSITVKYFYDKEQVLKGKLFLYDAAGNRMMEENVQFGFTKAGKWNQFTVNTGSQINAGNYRVKLELENGKGLGVSGIEVQ